MDPTQKQEKEPKRWADLAQIKLNLLSKLEGHSLISHQGYLQGLHEQEICFLILIFLVLPNTLNILLSSILSVLGSSRRTDLLIGLP